MFCDSYDFLVEASSPDPKLFSLLHSIQENINFAYPLGIHLHELLDLFEKANQKHMANGCHFIDGK